ncbi:hypothetical protein BJV82DRAFT_601597 [Fennellomyces sp. T-0311]|nr:hypothetical protein BJV82DRAFT_601597 [Fennellomyces sp. T-0311]
MSSDDEDDELRDFQNGDSSSDGDSDSISCDDDDDDSVRLHGDGRTLRTPGLLKVDDLLCDDHLPELVEGNLKKLPTLDTKLSNERDGREPESNTQELSKSPKRATVARSTAENRQRYTTGVAGQG